MIHRIENGKIALALDSKANLVELRNLATGRDYAGGQGLWRLIYSHDEVMEEEILPEDCEHEIEVSAEGRLKAVCRKMKGPSGEEAFSLRFEAWLDGEDVKLSAELANESKLNRVIREFNFPSVRNLKLGERQELFGGINRVDPAKAVEACHTLYKGEDQKGVDMPWWNLGFAFFADERDGLYFGDHDPRFEISAHLFRKRGSQLDACLHKSPFLAPGETRKYEGYVLSPFAGDWHRAAKKFRAWAESSWFKPNPRPSSLANGFNGWYRLIMRQQYGKILFPHDQMPRILKSMKETGIDTLFVFGWWREGMDAGYPDYAYDEAQGGKEALKERFRQFQANGGKIILYYNGRLIDTATEFYKKRADALSIKGCDGRELIDRYMFGGPGIDLRHQFGYKSFALACPHSKEWMKILEGHIDRAVELGVDGVFFDQLGMAEAPCWDPRHGHKVPMTDGRAARMAQLKTLRERLRSKNPKMSFGVEMISNFTAPFVDFYHSYPGYNAASNDWMKNGEKPKLSTFPELFRYTFPELLASDRDIREDVDIERRVNLAVLRGLVSDVEVHRCRTLIDDGAPFYKSYLAKVDKLRDRFRRLILNGLFQDTDGASCDNKELFWSVFKAGDELAVIATQSHLPEASAKFEVPGYAFSETGFVGEADVSGGDGFAKAELKRHALAVMVFKKA